MKPTIIYLRTSTEEQNPENQLKDCEALAQRLNLIDYDVIKDKISGWKEIEREGFDNLKKAISNKQVDNLLCWDLDRLFRNRKRLIAFFEYCKAYDCKIYSFRQDWLESINKITPPFNEIVHSLMLQVMGWLSEEESNKKSERTKNAVRREQGVTRSYKGNKWGRKSLSRDVIDVVVSLNKQGISIRDIAKQVTYWDKNNNQKYISRSAVHKIITKNPVKNT